jgi:hypothetical protein
MILVTALSGAVKKEIWEVKPTVESVLFLTGTSVANPSDD